jgi:hypothetical protein
MSNLYPANTLDQVKSIEGDANIYGNVYLGLVGSGWIYMGNSIRFASNPPLPQATASDLRQLAYRLE